MQYRKSLNIATIIAMYLDRLIPLYLEMVTCFTTIEKLHTANILPAGSVSGHDWYHSNHNVSECSTRYYCITCYSNTCCIISYQKSCCQLKHHHCIITSLDFFSQVSWIFSNNLYRSKHKQMWMYNKSTNPHPTNSKGWGVVRKPLSCSHFPPLFKAFLGLKAIHRVKTWMCFIFKRIYSMPQRAWQTCDGEMVIHRHHNHGAMCDPIYRRARIC